MSCFIGQIERHLCAFLLITVGLCSAAAEQQKISVPSAPDVKEKISLVREVYEDDLKNSRSSRQKLALAERFLADAVETKDDIVGRFVLFNMAREVAAEGGSIEVAYQAIDQMHGEYDVDLLTLELRTLQSLGMAVRDRDGQRQLVERANESTQEALNTSRYDIAIELAEFALAKAKKANDVATIKEAESLSREVEEVRLEHTAIEQIWKTLKATPDDSAANSAVGKFLCFVKADWEAGLPLLAIGNEEQLKRLAERELSAPTKPEDCVDLGDDWWSLSQQQDGRRRRILLAHAKDFYLDALPQLSGLTETRVRKRLADLKELIPRTVTLPSGAVVAFDFEPESLQIGGRRRILKDLTNGGSDASVPRGRSTDFEEGMHGEALYFSHGFVTFSDKNLPKGDSPRSILFWMKSGWRDGDQAQFGYGTLQEGSVTYTVLYDKSRKDKVKGKLYVGNLGGKTEECGDAFVADQKWHHVAVIYDGMGTVHLLIDGKADLSFKRRYDTASAQYAYIGFNGEYKEKTHANRVGKYMEAATRFNGAIDDFVIFDRALTTDEVIAIKDRGLSN